MSGYDETNRGSLWRNERKTEKFHSDLKGKINVNGVEHWFDGYLKDPNGHPQAPELKVIIGKPCEPSAQQAAPQQAPPAMIPMPQMQQPVPAQAAPAPAQPILDPQQQQYGAAPQQQPQQKAWPVAAVPVDLDQDIPFS